MVARPLQLTSSTFKRKVRARLISEFGYKEIGAKDIVTPYLEKKIIKFSKYAERRYYHRQYLDKNFLDKLSLVIDKEKFEKVLDQYIKQKKLRRQGFSQRVFAKDNIKAFDHFSYLIFLYYLPNDISKRIDERVRNYNIKYKDVMNLASSIHFTYSAETKLFYPIKDDNFTDVPVYKWVGKECRMIEIVINSGNLGLITMRKVGEFMFASFTNKYIIPQISLYLFKVNCILSGLY